MADRFCTTCRSPLSGRQRNFCCRQCKNANTNNRNQNYAAQMKRGLRRKLALVASVGGKCKVCGYHRNLAALNWHHRVPGEKSFELDLRSLSNRRAAAIAAELEKCDLLCANCHAEVHYPHLACPP